MSDAFTVLASETITSDGTARNSSAVQGGATEVRLEPGGVCYVAVGATADDQALRISPLHPPVHLAVGPGQVVSTFSPNEATTLNIAQIVRVAT